MSNRICGRCRSTKVVIHGSYGGTTYYYCENCQDLGDKDRFPEMTIFHKLTASPEVLAPSCVYGDKDGYFYSTIIEGERFLTIVRAIAATVAKLKELEK